MARTATTITHGIDLPARRNVKCISRNHESAGYLKDCFSECCRCQPLFKRPFSALWAALQALWSRRLFWGQEPGGLLGVIQFRGAAGLLAQNVINVFEGLLKHNYNPFSSPGSSCRHHKPAASTGKRKSRSRLPASLGFDRLIIKAAKSRSQRREFKTVCDEKSCHNRDSIMQSWGEENRGKSKQPFLLSFLLGLFWRDKLNKTLYW